MSQRINIASGAKWEDIVGYSRAVRVGNLVFVTGTVATDGQGQLVGPGDMYAQTAQALRKIGAALEQAGASLADVVRTRLFVTDIGRWEEVARAHREVFGDIKPCTSMIEIKALIAPEYLIEIEADAVVGGE
jgi:enamine deaminase RidA (YjgF/YER057c/UK114 family)